MKPEQFQPLQRRFFIVAALEAGAAFIALARLPREPSPGLLLGYSAARLAMLAVLLGCACLGIYLGVRRTPRAIPRPRPEAILGCALAAGGLGLALFLLRYLDPASLLPAYGRLSPLLLYLLALALQSAVWLLLLRNGFDPGPLRARIASHRSTIFAICALALIVLIVAITRLGVTPDPAYWGEPGVPIMGWQLGIALCAGGAAVGLGLRFAFDPPAARPGRTDVLVAAAVWAAAVLIWLGVPTSVMAHSFYAPIVPPTNQPLPVADAALYDYLAQSILLGTAYTGWIPPRPLYVMFLAALHALFGQDYRLILAAQTCALALFPVALYFLGARLHSRAAGLIAAALAIFRELTTLWVSSETRVANTRTLMSDLPTALLIAVACIFFMRWLERKDLMRALLAGGVFGALLLLRTQSLLILPFILLLGAMAYGKPRAAWAPAAALFLLGVAAGIGPWLLHNYAASGRITFDDPTQLALVSSQYSLSDHLDLSKFQPQDSLAGNLIGFALGHPALVAGFIANHFLATEIGGVLALPLIEPYAGLLAPVNLYWTNWDGRLEWHNLTLVMLYLAVIGLGLGAAWNRLRWTGLAPLAFNIGYALANGIGRYSSWRYDLPVDWIPYLYFALGAAELFAAAALPFGADLRRVLTPAAAPAPPASLRPSRAALILGGFALLGFLPWILQVAVPPRFEDLTVPQLEERLAATAGLESARVRAFDANAGAVILRGQLLYPRFYRRNNGVAQATPWPAYAVRDYARLGFVVLDRELSQVILPGRAMPAGVVQGAEVIVLGCRSEGYVEARLIALPALDLFYTSGSLDQACPLP